MILDARNLDSTQHTADVLIVGSGPAGISLATQFLGTRQRVILMEAGGKEPSSEYEDFNQGKNTGPLFLDLANSRRRCFGGASKLWAGVCRPLEKRDFEKRDFVPLSGWPIQKSDLDPYYQKAAELLQFPEALEKDEPWIDRFETGAYFPKLGKSGSRLFGKVFHQISLEKRDFAKLFEAQLAQSQNVQVLLHSTLVELEMEPSGKSVTQAVAATLNGKRHRIRAKKIVLACGTIENARILKITRASRSKAAENVGRYFMSHPGFSDVGKILSFPETGCAKKASVNPANEHLTYEFQEELNRSNKILGHNFVLSQTRSTIQPLGRTILSKIRRGDFSLSGLSLQQFKSSFLFGTDEPKCPGSDVAYSKTWNVGISVEQMPNPNSRLELGTDRDALGQPRVSFHWDRIPELERFTTARAIRLLGLELGRMGMGRVQSTERLLKGSVFEISDSINHQMGTTRMSDSPETGVVNRDCRVFGIDNLYVAGGSVFATSGSVNPTFTIVALALRLADHLKNA